MKYERLCQRTRRQKSIKYARICKKSCYFPSFRKYKNNTNDILFLKKEKKEFILRLARRKKKLHRELKYYVNCFKKTRQYMIYDKHILVTTPVFNILEQLCICIIDNIELYYLGKNIFFFRNSNTNYSIYNIKNVCQILWSYYSFDENFLMKNDLFLSEKKRYTNWINELSLKLDIFNSFLDNDFDEKELQSSKLLYVVSEIGSIRYHQLSYDIKDDLLFEYDTVEDREIYIKNLLEEVLTTQNVIPEVVFSMIYDYYNIDKKMNYVYENIYDEKKRINHRLKYLYKHQNRIQQYFLGNDEFVDKHINYLKKMIKRKHNYLKPYNLTYSINTRYYNFNTNKFYFE